MLGVDSVVDWLKRRTCDQHGLGLKPTRAILLCPWEKKLYGLSLVWRSWQAVLNFSHIFIKVKNQNKKFQADSHILASPEAGGGNCLSNM